jgi:threonylcarbamoyladenosine tRNA methylthiotransferase MtaB
VSAADPQQEPRVVTFGCRLNAFESEVMRGHARAAGLNNAVIVNTCAVTAEAERQARQAIRKARREHPEAAIIVTGCSAQIDPARYAAMPEVDRVIGNAEKLRAESFVAKKFAPGGPRVAVADIMAVTETAGHLIEGFAERTRAFIEVQQGCDHRCTFCIIPFGRGPSRSVPVGEVVRQVRALVEGGVAEVVLSGVDLTDYGKALPGAPGLGQLVRRLLKLVPELPRLRLSSLDPVEVDEELLRALAEEARLCPHLHLSLQAGSDVILKRMKRRHSRADAERLVARARALRPDVVFGADLIAGFPTESDADFAETLGAVEALGLTHLHVFPYSPRPGTPAARMPQVDPAQRKARAAMLRAAGDAALRRHLKSQVGGAAEVLIEKPGFGRTPHYAPVALDSDAVGKIVPAKIVGTADDKLVGSVVHTQSSRADTAELVDA